jgi:putative phosphoribosyl transferase
MRCSSATLRSPEGARGVVLFAHGSGSSRHSSRNRFVAEHLQRGGLATLLIDLLTAEEEAVDIRTGHPPLRHRDARPAAVGRNGMAA